MTGKQKLDLKIIPTLLPSSVGLAVTLLVLGKQLTVLITSLVAGYFAFLLASVLIEFLRVLKRRRH